MLQRKVLIAQDAGSKGNPNHSKENGEFTSGSGSHVKDSGKANYPHVVEHKNTENWNTKSAFKTPQEAAQAASELKSKYPNMPVRVKEYTGGKATTEKSENWPQSKEEKLKQLHTDIGTKVMKGTLTKEEHAAGRAERDRIMNEPDVSEGAKAAAEFEGPAAAGPADPNRNNYPSRWPKDSPEQKEISRQLTEHWKNKTSKDEASDAEPAMALDPNSGQPQSKSSPDMAIPWKGKNLDDNPVGDCYSSTPTADSGGAVWSGRTLD